jgi:hypothetical protein
LYFEIIEELQETFMFDKDFLDKTPKVQATKGKLDKMGYVYQN